MTRPDQVIFTLEPGMSDSEIDSLLTYWLAIRLLRLTLRVSELEKFQGKLLKQLTRPYEDWEG